MLFYSLFRSEYSLTGGMALNIRQLMHLAILLLIVILNSAGSTGYNAPQKLPQGNDILSCTVRRFSDLSPSSFFGIILLKTYGKIGKSAAIRYPHS